MNPAALLACGVVALVLLSAQAAPTGDSKGQKDIFEINQEAGLLGQACPGFKCDKDCDFGYDTDADGCFVCSCISDDKEVMYQGDMVLDREGKRRVLHGDSGSRAAIIRGHWPGGRVPYTIDQTIVSESSGLSAIAEAIADFHKYTCLRFFQRTNEKAYISFYRGRGCSSPVGRMGYGNDISLASGCWYKGTVIHEIMHSLGFYHEQSRPDRDDYVEILWDNIQPGMSYNFQRRQVDQIDSLGTPYDHRSIMHYGRGAFGYGTDTIRTKDASKQNLIGQRSGLSDIDIKQLNLRYKCASSGTSGTTASPTVTPTASPTVTPTASPTVTPTAAPTAEPCQEGDGASYRGTVSVTETGKTCQRWDRQTPHAHSYTPANYPSSGLEQNYCRNPDGHTEVWCYTTDPGTRWERCDVPVCGEISTVAPTAAAVCQDKDTNCPDWNHYCKSSQYIGYMEENCPKTCGKCGGAASTVAYICEDKNQNCPGWNIYCTNSRYITYMEENCPKTCDTCGSGGAPNADLAEAPAVGPCEDRYWKCPRLKRHCGNPKYQAKVKFCPKTCGTCGGGEAPDVEAVCVDKHPTCPKRKRHCGKKRMQKLCPKTCGRCARVV